MSTFTLKSVTCFMISFGLVLSQSCTNTIPPLLCWAGTRNTTGLHANTEYTITRLSGCSKQIFPPYICTGVPGSPKNVHYNGSGYDFNLYWSASRGAGGERSTLMGFRLTVVIEPCNGSPLPNDCYYVNITETRIIRYVLGTFLFSCNYTQQGHVTVIISSYPTPEMCAANVTVPEPNTQFYVPFEMEPSVSTRMSTVQTTAAPDPVRNIVILTSLAVSSVFIMILIAVICIWKKPCKAQLPLSSLTRELSSTSIDSSYDNATYRAAYVSAEVRCNESALTPCSQHSDNGRNENISVNDISYLSQELSHNGLNGEGIHEDLNADGNAEQVPTFCRFWDMLPVSQSERTNVHRERQLQVHDTAPFYAFNNGNDSRYQHIRVQGGDNLETDITELNESQYETWKQFIVRLNLSENID